MYIHVHCIGAWIKGRIYTSMVTESPLERVKELAMGREQGNLSIFWQILAEKLILFHNVTFNNFT